MPSLRPALASWLCPTELDRRRAVDTSARIKRARVVVAVLIGAALIALAPLLSWWLLVLFAVQFTYLWTLDGRMARSSYPELQAAGGMATTEAVMATAVAITGGASSPLMPILVIPVMMVAARFRPRVQLLAVVIGAVLILAIGLGTGPGELAANPASTIVALVLLGSVCAIAFAIQAAEVQHRKEAVLDPLTGLLNRKALESRFDEIEQQARLGGGSVCLIALDLDHFKHVNDALGHSRGDEVLKDAAYELRKCLHSFELIYRIGGEEFLVVLPGLNLAGGLEVAERLRLAVSNSTLAGVKITVSLGVAAASGAEVDFDPLFAGADEALYTAKHEGRDRVVSRDPAPSPLPQPVPA